MILSFDPGTNKIGAAALDLQDGLIKLIDSQQVPLGKTKRPESRLRNLQIFAEEYMSKFSNVTSIALEKTFVQPLDKRNKSKNITIDAPLKLSMSRGIIYAAAGAHNLLITEYQPTVIKRTVTGDAKANKHMIMRAVGKIFEKDFQEDEADAIAIGIHHLSSLKMRDS